MNYREKIRKAIECPQFGNETYGEWGALNLEQRKYIKRLLDELDRADNYIKELCLLKNKKQKETIDKAIEYIEGHKYTMKHYEPYGTPTGLPNYETHNIEGYYQLLDILKEVSE